MTTANIAPPSQVEQTELKPELAGIVLEEMRKMNEAEQRKLVNVLVEEIEGAKFKLGYALSMIEHSRHGYRNIVADWPTPLKRYIAEQIVNSVRLVDSGVPWRELAGVPWSRLNHMAEFLEFENLGQVVSAARRGTFAEFTRNTELARRLALAERAARNRVYREWAKKGELAA